jgi:DNA polymerase/3'-5' exonuclease PolX
MRAVVRMPLVEAEQVASEILHQLLPTVIRAEVAGSIRRRKADIGDIEIVCVPRMETVQTGLFGDPEEVNLLEGLISEMCSSSRMGYRLDAGGRMCNGPRHKSLDYHGYALDLFSVLPPAQWGVILAIRTGSADFSHRLVTHRHQGGMLPEWARVKDGAIYHRDGTLIPTPEETDVFRVLGIDYLAPEARV